MLIYTSGSKTLFWLIILLIYNTELMFFLITNSHNYNLLFTNSSVNLLLSNNLNKYHPFIFYSSVFITIYLTLFASLHKYSRLLFLRNNNSLHSKASIIKAFQINTFALFLGSWWALQEGTWGGWWNWDASEVLGLLIGLNAILSFHSFQWYANNIQFTERLKLNFLLITFCFYFIQLNFDLVSHNFGASLFMFFSSNSFFLEAVYVTLIFSAIVYFKVYTYRVRILVINSVRTIYTKLTYTSISYLSISLNTSVIIILMSSFLPLLNYFFWNYFEINSFNININVNYYIVIVLLAVTIAYSEAKYLNIFTIIIITSIWSQSIISLILLLTYTYFKSRYWIHYTIILLITLNTLSYYVNFTYFNSYITWEDLYDGDLMQSNLMTSFICSNYFIEKTELITSTYGYQINLWNVLYFTNITTSNSLSLSLDIFKLSTWLILPSEWHRLIMISGNSFLLNELNALLVLSLLVWLSIITQYVFHLRIY